MSVLSDQLRDAVEALGVGDGVVTWFGTPEPLGATPASAVAVLAGRLYRDWYRRGGAAPREADPPGPLVGATETVGDAITRLVTRPESLQRGWRRTGVDGDAVVVERDGLRLVAGPDHILPGGDDGEVAVRMPTHLPSLAPDYHLVLGARDLDGTGTRQVRRTYLHATARGAAPVVAALVEALDAADVPFRVKALTNPWAYVRCDAVVCFTRAEDEEAVTGALAAVHRRHRDHLRAPTPRLTDPAAPGVGRADDPGGGDSFGGHRCRLVAEALLDAHARRISEPVRRLRHVERVLAARGIDPDAPHRAAGTAR